MYYWTVGFSVSYLTTVACISLVSRTSRKGHIVHQCWYCESAVWQGNLIAVGTYKGYTQIWDVAANKKINNLHGHTARVGKHMIFLRITEFGYWGHWGCSCFVLNVLLLITLTLVSVSAVSCWPQWRTTCHHTTSVWKMPPSWHWTGHSGGCWHQAEHASWTMMMMMMYIVGALAWNADLLASGSRDRMIMLHDTRIVPVVPEKRLAGHRQEVTYDNLFINSEWDLNSVFIVLF